MLFLNFSIIFVPEMKHIIYTYCILFLCILSLYAQPKHEIRAVWLTTNYGLDWPSRPVRSIADVEVQKAELNVILDKIQASKMNVVFFQSRLRGDVTYPSAIEPWSRFIKKSYDEYSGYDPLKFAIEACHKRGLECHAWLVVYPMGKTELINRNANGKDNRLTKQLDGETYLDPGNPDTNGYLLAIIDEIVRNYDVDGIHFDYIRYPDKADAFPDFNSYSEYGKSKNVQDWRRENINKFVYLAYDKIKALKPWVQVSSSVVGVYEKIESNKPYRTAFSEVYQDPIDWIIKGKHDFIVPMMYYPDDLFYASINNWTERSNGRWIVPGLGVYQLDESQKNWNADVILNQIDLCRRKNVAGMAYFRAQYLIENKKEILSKIESRFYQYPAVLPPLTWLDRTIPQAPKEPVAKWQRNAILLSWEKPQGEEKDLYYNVYYSQSESVDISDPKNLLATRLKDTNLLVGAKQGQAYYYVVTASNRFRNESVASKSVYFRAGGLAAK